MHVLKCMPKCMLKCTIGRRCLFAACSLHLNTLPRACQCMLHAPLPPCPAAYLCCLPVHATFAVCQCMLHAPLPRCLPLLPASACYLCCLPVHATFAACQCMLPLLPASACFMPLCPAACLCHQCVPAAHVLKRGMQVGRTSAKDLAENEAGYVYSYSYFGRGASAAFVSRYHFVVIDIAAGPSTYGPQVRVLCCGTLGRAARAAARHHL
eukprot:366431-Chlamydomonas_euryale.AAC.25